MNKLNQLLKELCPNGVNEKKLSEVAVVERGKRVVREQLPEDGKYFVFQNSLTPLGKINECNYKENTTFVIGAGAAGEIGYSRENFWAADDCYPLVCSEAIDDRYLYHLMLSKQPYIVSQVRKGSIPRLSRKVIESISIPVPPLEVQREIVRILDNFTELTAELTAELEARKKQYEYYRDRILSCEYRVEWMTIDECTEKTSNIKWKETDGQYQYIDLSSVDRETSSIIQTSTIDKNTAPSRAQQIVHTDDILFGTTRPLLRRYCIVPEEYNNQIASTGYCVLRAKKNVVLPYYLYFLISAESFYRYLEPLQIEGSYPSVTNSNVKAYKIPVPDISIQKKLVRVLTNFESICNDLNIGLPAEIEARQKQYEYYRDMLLTFAETGAIISSETGDRRPETGDRRPETGDRRPDIIY